MASGGIRKPFGLRAGSSQLRQNTCLDAARSYPRSASDNIPKHTASPPAEDTRKQSLLILSDQEFSLGCLRCWLREFCPEFDIHIIGGFAAFADGDFANAAVAIIDASHSGLKTDWLQSQLALARSLHANLPLVVIGVAALQPLLRRLDLQGYIPTTSSMELAAAAVRLVVAGGRYFPSPETPPPAPIRVPGQQNSHSASLEPSAGLTPRERLVLDLLERGLPNKIIAYELKMSLGTTKLHVHNIIRKLNVRNRTEAAHVANRRSLQARDVIGREQAMIDGRNSS